MRGVVRHAELDQGRGRDHRADDVGRGDRYGEADDPDDQRRVDRRQQQTAAGVRNHDRRELQAKAGQSDDADDDAGARASGCGIQCADRAVSQRTLQLRRHQCSVLAQEAEQERCDDRIEHRQCRRVADHHEDHDGDERDEVEAVALGHCAERHLRCEVDVTRMEALGVEFDHDQQREIIETGRDGGHPDHVEIADLEKLRDQERRSAQHWRRQDGAEPARGEKAAGRVFLEAGLLHHRIRDCADHHGRGDARSRRPAEQERRQDHGASGAVRLAAHHRQREVDEEFSGARLLEKRPEDREQDNECRGHIDSDAKDALERDEEVANKPRQIVSAMCPGRGEIWTEHRVGDEQDGDHGHDRAGGAACRFEDEDDENHADDHVPAVGRRGAVGEIVAAPQSVNDGCDGENAGKYVPPAHAVTEARGQRKQQEGEQQRERDVGVAKLLRRNDRVGRIEMKQAHRDGDVGDSLARQPAEPVGRAFIRFDEFLSLAQSLIGNDRRVIARR